MFAYAFTGKRIEFVIRNTDIGLKNPVAVWLCCVFPARAKTFKPVLVNVNHPNIFQTLLHQAPVISFPCRNILSIQSQSDNTTFLLNILTEI